MEEQTLTAEEYSYYFYTRRKLTAEQARQEIRFACGAVPKLYGITTRTFDDVRNQFGPAFERHGLGGSRR